MEHNETKNPLVDAFLAELYEWKLTKDIVASNNGEHFPELDVSQQALTSDDKKYFTQKPRPITEPDDNGF